MKPNYIKIFSDIINTEYPEEKEILKHFENKQNLDSLAVLNINDLIFKEKLKNKQLNIKHKSYDLETIKYVLKDQKNNNMTNVEIANKYKLSRNTIASWKNKFSI